MGNSASTAIAVAKAKNQLDGAINDITGGGGNNNNNNNGVSAETEAKNQERKKKLQERQKDRDAAYKEKQALHAERKAKLSQQWNSNRTGS